MHFAGSVILNLIALVIFCGAFLGSWLLIFWPCERLKWHPLVSVGIWGLGWAIAVSIAEAMA